MTYLVVDVIHYLGCQFLLGKFRIGINDNCVVAIVDTKTGHFRFQLVIGVAGLVIAKKGLQTILYLTLVATLAEKGLTEKEQQ